MWEVSHAVAEQILFRAVVTWEVDGVVLLEPSGDVADMIGWRHDGRIVSAFNVE
jgi:hypothetical protein